MDLWWVKACGNETVLLWRLLTSLVTPNSGLKLNAKDKCQCRMRRVLNPNAQNLKQTLNLAGVVHHIHQMSGQVLSFILGSCNLSGGPLFFHWLKGGGGPEFFRGPRGKGTRFFSRGGGHFFCAFGTILQGAITPLLPPWPAYGPGGTRIFPVS